VSLSFILLLSNLKISSGGEVLAQINEQRAKYSDFEIFATYRKDEHADALRERGVEPVLLDLENVDKLKTFVKDKNSEQSDYLNCDN
jgi:saccharopine dehydrogenase-like NADP-dependent oxidoreductase